MSYPISLYGDDSLAKASLLYLGMRWQEEKYIPIVTEVTGLFQVVQGSYFFVSGCKQMLNDYHNGTTITYYRSITPKTSVVCSACYIADGVFKMLYLPASALQCGINLGSRAVNALSNCRKGDKEA